MNASELKMVDMLKDMRDNHAVVGVKAEFEAEGTRTEELMRLKEICLAAKVALTLKIGGCEAVRDMYDARTVGVNYLVAAEAGAALLDSYPIGRVGGHNRA